MAPSPPPIAIAGASGLVGQALAHALTSAGQPVLGISRRQSPPPALEALVREAAADGALTWRRADFYSRLDAFTALEGVERAIYLVHTLEPAARLTQAERADLEVICADNFARAAAAHGLRHVIYVRCCTLAHAPDGPFAAGEVEQVLASRSTPVTTILTTPLIDAHSPLWLWVRAMAGGRAAPVHDDWLARRTRPLALPDLVALVAAVLERDDLAGTRIALTGPEEITIEALVKAASTALLHKLEPSFAHRFEPFAIHAAAARAGLAPWQLREVLGRLEAADAPPTPDISRPDATPAGATPAEATPAEATPAEVPPADCLPGVALLERPLTSLRAMLEQAARAGRQPALPVATTPATGRSLEVRRARESTVRSIQRLTLPAGRNAVWVAREYARWLSSFLGPLVRADVEESPSREIVRFVVAFIPWPLLVLDSSPQAGTPDRQLYWIRAGLLVRQAERGRLEFREVLGGRFVIAAIHDFVPRLPWPIYRATQALVHAWVMRNFARHLERISADPG